MQRNWIGKSEGADITFDIKDSDKTFNVFTTRPDTLFGATYCVLAPEHPLVSEITHPDAESAVSAYVKDATNKSDLQRTDLATEKTGVFTGASAINPCNNQPIPIWVADYVLMTYGTGAIMAVPGHDERDHEFATTFDIPIVEVISPISSVAQGPRASATTVQEQAFEGDGVCVNSDFLNGLQVADAKEKMITWLESEKERHASGSVPFTGLAFLTATVLG